MKFPASVRVSDLTTDDAESDSDDNDRDVDDDDVEDDDESNAEDGEQDEEVRAYSFSCHHSVENKHNDNKVPGSGVNSNINSMSKGTFTLSVNDWFAASTSLSTLVRKNQLDLQPIFGATHLVY